MVLEILHMLPCTVHVPYTYVNMIVHSNAYTTLTVNTLTGVKLIKS